MPKRIYRTVCVTEAELLAMSESPLKVAVTFVEPTASVDVVNFAFPAHSGAVPSTVLPTANITGPVGVTVGEVIVAVKVTA